MFHEWTVTAHNAYLRRKQEWKATSSYLLKRVVPPCTIVGFSMRLTFCISGHHRTSSPISPVWILPDNSCSVIDVILNACIIPCLTLVLFTRTHAHLGFGAMVHTQLAQLSLLSNPVLHNELAQHITSIIQTWGIDRKADNHGSAERVVQPA